MEYIFTVPPYYAQVCSCGACDCCTLEFLYHSQPMRKAFEMIGAPSNIIPDSFDGQMSYSITNYLRKLKKQVRSLQLP